METKAASSTIKLVFNFIGIFCAFSFFLCVLFLVEDGLGGSFDKTRLFFDSQPGIQPFIIFVGPVILIGGPAWIWRWIMEKFNK